MGLSSLEAIPYPNLAKCEKKRDKSDWLIFCTGHSRLEKSIGLLNDDPPAYITWLWCISIEICSGNVESSALHAAISSNSYPSISIFNSVIFGTLKLFAAPASVLNLLSVPAFSLVPMHFSIYVCFEPWLLPLYVLQK